MNWLISILGPTGIGKTNLTFKLAKFFKTEIISCDSRQFYKELNIGTSKPNNTQLKLVKHHFIGNKSIFEDYNVFIYKNEVIKKIKKLYKSYNILFLVGGSFLYEKSIIEGLDNLPIIKNKKKLLFYRKKLYLKNNNYLLKKIKIKDFNFYKNILKNKKDKRKIIRALEILHFTKKKISNLFNKKKEEKPFKKYIRIGLIDKREKIYNNINCKVDQMIKNGLYKEVQKLYKYRDLNPLNTIGYKEFFKNNFVNIEKIITDIKKNSRNYAKRQIIWLRKMKDIYWFKPNNYNKILEFILNKLKNIY
ncbi:MAG: tRNA (adenosine(37)-N6)-dimethylallyltransferase MiaA [Candidatus Shikimatogenerans sp. JK-2022]|nr:tRNA (adenosine(37)-N6)-dimethylallyltransferase MiaA [Candidatus Shikimatogenerans bostrichidophilus]